MIFLIFMEFIAFPNREDAILQKAQDSKQKINVDASGSLGLYYKGKCNKTYPNETLVADEKIEWCSNIAKSKEDKPWISYNLPSKSMSITGYSIRNGCCWYACCCADDGRIIDYKCCCRLYSFSLQGSNDNRTWETIHKVEKEDEFWGCKTMTYEFKEATKSYRIVRLVQDEEYPNCPFCMQINQVELYGTTKSSSDIFDTEDYIENDESVSIIGKIDRRRNE